MTSPQFYGMAASGDDCGWLFTENVGEERFCPTSPRQRTLSAQWLARMHSAAARLDSAARLPDRGPAHYFDHLRLGRETIARNLDNPALSAEDRRLLRAVSAQCDAVERAWGGIERFCATVPCTLVHGDFRSKNVRLRVLGSRTTLFPIDWETAGWGVPAADLAATRGVTPLEQVDLAAYASMAHDYWPRVDANVLHELVTVGAVFRRLAAISWDSLDLSYASPQSRGQHACVPGRPAGPRPRPARLRLAGMSRLRATTKPAPARTRAGTRRSCSAAPSRSPRAAPTSGQHGPG